MGKKVIVIGAGFGGLASAALLAKEGFDVHIYEKNESPGGRAMKFDVKGFRFDMGPSWYLMPEAFDNFFALFGKKTSDYYELQKLSPSYRVFFSQQEYYDITSKLSESKKLFERISPGSSDKLQQYITLAEKRYSKALDKFLYREYETIKDIIDIELVKEIATAGLLQSLSSHAAKYFSDNRLQKILTFNTVFLGVAPSKTPALYSMLSYADLVKGVYYPTNGMYSVIEGLVKLCQESGVTFHYKRSVNKIITKNNHAQYILLDSKIRIDADIIISNADYYFTETRLLDKKSQSYHESYWNKKSLAPSAFVIYLGVKKKIKKLSHHSLFLGTDWKKNFKEIFDTPVWPSEPSYYVCTPSKTDPTVAPKGHENIFILVPISPLLKDTDKNRQLFRNKIIAHLEHLIGEKFQEDIVYEKIFTLTDYEKTYNAFQGTAFGLSHTLFQTALFRPKLKSKKINNLYYTGAYTHPGIGMPTSVISGQLTAQKIIREHDI